MAQFPISRLIVQCTRMGQGERWKLEQEWNGMRFPVRDRLSVVLPRNTIPTVQRLETWVLIRMALKPAVNGQSLADMNAARAD